MHDTQSTYESGGQTLASDLYMADLSVEPAEKLKSEGMIPTSIAKAIIAIQSKLEPLVKSAANEAFNSSYVPLEDVTKKAHELLSEHKIGIIQAPVTDSAGFAALETILFTGSGQSFSRVSKLSMNASKVDPQSHGSAITYMRRYALMAILGLTGQGEDDDGNRAANVQTPPTEEQIRELKMMMTLLSYTQADLSKVINAIRTKDAASLALTKYRDLVSQKQKQIDVEPDTDDGGPIETEPEEVSPTSLEGFKRRLKALGLASEDYERKVISMGSGTGGRKGTPFINNVMEKQERIEGLDAFLRLLESGVQALEPEFYAPTDEPRTVEINVA